MKIFMKYFLLIFISVFSNQIWSQDIVINFGKEIKTAQTAEIYKTFLDKYFNDKCKIKINETEIILKEKNFQNYIDYILENSMISTDVEVSYEDKIVALVTCSYENGINGNLRFVVFAKMTKQYTVENEEEYRLMRTVK